MINLHSAPAWNKHSFGIVTLYQSSFQWSSSTKSASPGLEAPRKATIAKLLPTSCPARRKGTPQLIPKGKLMEKDNIGESSSKINLPLFIGCWKVSFQRYNPLHSSLLLPVISLVIQLLDNPSAIGTFMPCHKFMKNHKNSEIHH
jgi:hypothetical protein